MRADARDLVLDCHGAPSAPRPSQSPIDRVLLWIAVALIAAGTFLGVSKHGQPLVPRARELFVPGGLMLLVTAWRSRRHQPVASISIGLVGLALIGVGAHEAVAGPWTLLAVPVTAVGCLACPRAAVRAQEIRSSSGCGGHAGSGSGASPGA